MVCGQASFLFDQPLRVVEDFSRNHATIDDDQTQSSLAIIQDKATRMKLVVNIGGFMIGEAAVDGYTEPG
jgi:hypothetical protein